MKTTLKEIPVNNFFSRWIIRLWSNTNVKYIEQNSKQSTTETAIIYLRKKSVDIIMLRKFKKASFHREYLVTGDFIVRGKNQKEKHHCPALVRVLWDMKNTLKEMQINNLFSRRIIILWSNTDAKFIERNSKQSTTETATFHLPPKSVDIMMLTKFKRATLHLEYLGIPDFIVCGKNQKEKYHCSPVVWVLWDMKTTLKQMPINYLFPWRIIRLRSNIDAKFLERNSKQSMTETATIWLPPKSVDIIVFTKFAKATWKSFKKQLKEI